MSFLTTMLNVVAAGLPIISKFIGDDEPPKKRDPPKKTVPEKKEPSKNNEQKPTANPNPAPQNPILDSVLPNFLNSLSNQLGNNQAHPFNGYPPGSQYQGWQGGGHSTADQGERYQENSSYSTANQKQKTNNHNYNYNSILVPPLQPLQQAVYPPVQTSLQPQLQNQQYLSNNYVPGNQIQSAYTQTSPEYYQGGLPYKMNDNNLSTMKDFHCHKLTCEKELTKHAFDTNVKHHEIDSNYQVSMQRLRVDDNKNNYNHSVKKAEIAQRMKADDNRHATQIYHYSTEYMKTKDEIDLKDKNGQREHERELQTIKNTYNLSMENYKQQRIESDNRQRNLDRERESREHQQTREYQWKYSMLQAEQAKFGQYFEDRHRNRSDVKHMVISGGHVGEKVMLEAFKQPEMPRSFFSTF